MMEIKEILAIDLAREPGGGVMDNFHNFYQQFKIIKLKVGV